MGLIHPLGVGESGRSTGNSRDGRLQCRLCTQNRTSGLTEMVLHESPLIISASGYD